MFSRFQVHKRISWKRYISIHPLIWKSQYIFIAQKISYFPRQIHGWNFQGIFQCYTCGLENRISLFVSQEGKSIKY